MENNKYQTLQFLPELSLFEIQQRIFIQKTPFEMIMDLKNKDDGAEVKEDDRVFYE